jgi:hypothetical protein
MALLKFLLPLVFIPILLRLALRAPLSQRARVGALTAVLGASLLLLAICWMAPTALQFRAVVAANLILLVGVAVLGVDYWRTVRRDPPPR